MVPTATGDDMIRSGYFRSSESIRNNVIHSKQKTTGRLPIPLCLAQFSLSSVVFPFHFTRRKQTRRNINYEQYESNGFAVLTTWPDKELEEGRLVRICRLVH